MVGDTDYDGVFGAEKDVVLVYSIPAHLFYASFILLVTIVFMNLLLALAVSDVQVGSVSVGMRNVTMYRE